MSSALYRLGAWAFRAKATVLVAALAVLLALIGLAGLVGTGTDNTYAIPGTESQDALDSLARTFPEVSGTSAQLVAVVPAPATVRDADVQSAIEGSISRLEALAQVSQVASPYASDDSPNLSADGAAALVPVQLTVGATSVLPLTADALQAEGQALAATLPDGSEVAVGGQLFSQTATGISVTELLGIAVAFVVLLLTFGTLTAAGLPLTTALIGVGASLSIVLAATALTTVTSTTPLLALMLGLAVGIDYALFLVARAQELLRGGLDPPEAAARAVATAGSAVVFAAMTVLIALAGLAVAGIPFLTTMGLAAALAVAVAVVVTLTVAPALLGVVGWHAVPRRFRPPPAAPGGAARGDDEASGHGETPENAIARDAAKPGNPTARGDDEPGVGQASAAGDGDAPAEPARDAGAPPHRYFRGWVRAAIRWPVVTIVLLTGGLVVAALPAAHMRLALPDAGSLDTGAPARVAYDLIAEHFGPGYNGPLLVTGTVIESTDPVGLLNDLAAELADVDGVAAVPLATPNDDGDTGIVQVIPRSAPDSAATQDLVAAIRTMHDDLQERYGVDLSVTGYTAAGIDVSARLAGALVPFGILVVGLSLVLLTMVFRSLLVPITAALGYTLSIGAALGLTTLVFVDGVAAGLLDIVDVGSVISFMPIILMGVLFGLAMDYEVFLVSRMREDFVRSGDARAAIERGFVASARVVTAAATIMFAVFVAFVPEGDASIQPIAFGLAVGVAIDAFVVRMTLIPALLRLFGRAAWFLPRWLDRVLPRFDIEGAGIGAELALADWPDGTPAIAAEAASLGLGEPHTLRLEPGEALVVSGGTATDRRTVLLTLSGRRLLGSGRLKVAGLVLPVRAPAVRRRTAYVALAGPHPARALREAQRSEPRVLFLDDADAVTDPIEQDRIVGILRATDAALVVAAQEEFAAAALLPEARTIRVHSLDRVREVV